MPCGKSNSGVGYAQLAGRSGSKQPAAKLCGKLWSTSKLQRTFLWVQAGHRLVYQRPHPLTRRLARAAPLAPTLTTSHSPSHSERYSSINSDSWLMHFAIISDAGFGLRLKNCQLHWRRASPAKNTFAKCAKKTPHTRMNICRCVRVCNLWT